LPITIPDAGEDTPGVITLSQVRSLGAAPVNTIADLRALAVPSPGPARDAIVLGYYAAGDGGGGLFYWNAASSLADDGGAVIKPTAVVGNGRWLRDIEPPLNVKWWGAKGTYSWPSDTTDDYPAFAAALAYITRIFPLVPFPQGMALFVPAGTYRIGSTLNIAQPIDLYGEGKTSTYLRFINTGVSARGTPIDGIVFQRGSNVPSDDASYARVRKMGIEGDGNSYVFSNAPQPLWNEYDPLTSTTTGHAYIAGCGVILLSHNTMIDDCTVAGFMLDGVHVEAIAGSDNANDWVCKDTSVEACGRHAIFVAGDNGNAGYCTGFDANENTAWGVYDRSFLGNHYDGNQTAGNFFFVADSLAVWINTFVVGDDLGTSSVWIGSKQGGIYASTTDNAQWRSLNIGIQNPSDSSGYNAIRLCAITCFARNTSTKAFAGSGAVNAGILGGGVFVQDLISTVDQWAQSNSGLTDTDVRTLAYGNGKLLAGTHTGGVFLSSNDATTWAASNSGLTNHDVRGLIYDPNNVGTFYAATQGGVFKSTDSGATWTAKNTGITSTLGLCIAIDPSSANLYFGTSDGKVFQSTNGGTSWSLVFTQGSGFPIQSIAVSLATPAHVFAATNGAGMYTSLDTGATWNQTNTGLVDQQSGAPLLNISMVTTDSFGTVYIAPIGNHYGTDLHNNGGAYRSTNDASSWTFIANTLSYGGGYSAIGALAPCTFVGCYSESGQNNWVQPPSVIIGGILATEVIPPPDGYSTPVITGTGLYEIPVFGPVRPKIRQYANLNSFPIRNDDSVILVDVPSGHTCQTTLPNPGSAKNRQVTIIKTNSSLYSIEIDGTMSGGLTQLFIDQQGAGVTLLCDGVKWILVNQQNINNPSVNELDIAGTPNYPVLGGIPLYAGNYLITVYYRVTISPTDVNIYVNWNDAGGAQTATIVNVSGAAVGSYAAVPIVINSLAGVVNEFIVKATVNNVHQVRVSCGVKFMS
jgi:hypothetical protein